MSFASSFEASSGAVRASEGPLETQAPQGLVRAGAERREIEQFIGEVFARRFDAAVPVFMPELVARRDALGRVVAAAGIRLASEPLFLEQYLDEPVDRAIERLTGRRPARARIAEVGQLAAARPGEGRRLIADLAVRLAARRIEWVVGTLTQELRHLFARMGIEPLVLERADPARLGAAAASWGRYYEHRPQVLAGHLPTAIARLRAARSVA
ncbi:thermostable hemolysin [Caldimonas sp. KR1-144]|uniref:thermostable hemolysin n=1 Tax=Caldimonas sp. KR1-144 TaxID=3400911 RepID=UPI003C0715BF